MRQTVRWLALKPKSGAPLHMPSSHKNVYRQHAKTMTELDMVAQRQRNVEDKIAEQGDYKYSNEIEGPPRLTMGKQRV
eukprot:1337401-Amphidinium_carterae.1